MASLPFPTPAPVYAICVSPSAVPQSDRVADVTSVNGITVAGYLSILTVLFFIVPLGIVLSRRYKWHDSAHVERFLLKRVALDNFKGAPRSPSPLCARVRTRTRAHGPASHTRNTRPHPPQA